MNNVKTNLLLCEDDVNLAIVMSDYLREHEYMVTHVTNGQEGLEAALTNKYDICLMDVLMPQKTGLEVLREIRESGITMPVIIVSQLGSKEDIIAGYQAGCDGYVVKPASMDILTYQIEAILKRIKMEEENQETVFQLGNVTFDAVKQRVGDERLSGRENELLLMLCRKRNQIVERTLILKSLWQVDNYFASRSLSVYINHLRHILSNVPEVRIVAVHGKGYKLIID